MYDKIYTYPDSNNQESNNKEKMKFGFKDILAMTIAAYQVILVPFSIFALTMVILFFVLKLILGG